MMPRARIIGLGQLAGGDDAVGIVVARELYRESPADVEIVEITDASALVTLLRDVDTAVVVDAVVAPPPGRLLEPSLDEVAASGAAYLSTHGIGIGEAVALARALAPGSVAREIHVLGITIDEIAEPAHRLTARVADAVPRAAERALHLTAPRERAPGADS